MEHCFWYTGFWGQRYFQTNPHSFEICCSVVNKKWSWTNEDPDIFGNTNPRDFTCKHVGSTEKAVGHAKTARFHVYHAGNKICVQRRALCAWWFRVVAYLMAVGTCFFSRNMTDVELRLEMKTWVHTPETGMVVCWVVYLKHRVNRCSLGVNMTHDP